MSALLEVDKLETVFFTRNGLVRAVDGLSFTLDRGEVRVAEPDATGTWQVNAWVKQAILLYFQISAMTVHEVGPFEFHDKIPLKHHLQAQGVRVVPPVGREGKATLPTDEALVAAVVEALALA